MNAQKGVSGNGVLSSHLAMFLASSTTAKLVNTEIHLSTAR